MNFLVWSFKCCLKSLILSHCLYLSRLLFLVLCVDMETYNLTEANNLPNISTVAWLCVLFYSSLVIDASLNVLVIVCISFTRQHTHTETENIPIFLCTRAFLHKQKRMNTWTCYSHTTTCKHTTSNSSSSSSRRWGNTYKPMLKNVHICNKSVHQHIDTAQGLSTIINTSSKANSMLNILNYSYTVAAPNV